MNTCKTCHIELDDGHIKNDGECFFCKRYTHKWKHYDYGQKGRELEELLAYYKEKYKSKPYDCLVPISGGKDSTYVLYLAKEKYGMRPLAFTFDNGLQTELARMNIKNAVDKLGVDHIVIAPDAEELRKMYRVFFEKTKNMCTVCNHMINTTIFQAAFQYELELILVGAVMKLETAPTYGMNRYCMEQMFKKVLEGNVDFEIDKYCNTELRTSGNYNPVTIFNYVDYDYLEVLDILTKRLGWKEAYHGDTKVDCIFHPVISYFKYKQNGISSAILMAASLLRDGQIDKAEYDRRIEKEKQHFQGINQKQLDEFFAYLELGPDILNQKVHILDYSTQMTDNARLEQLKNNIELSEIEKIEKLFEILRPELERDNGGVEIIDYSNDLLRIKLKGACTNCLQAQDTMLPYIESMLIGIVSDSIKVETVLSRPE